MEHEHIIKKLQDQQEYMISKFQSVVSNYDSMEKKTADLLANKDHVDKKLYSLDVSLESNTAEISTIKRTVSHGFELSFSRSANVDSALKSLGEQSEALKSRMATINSNIDFISGLISTQGKEIKGSATTASLESLKGLYELFKANTESQLKSLGKADEGLLAHINQLREENKKLSKSILDVNLALQKQAVMVESVLKDQNTFVDEINNDLSNIRKQLNSRSLVSNKTIDEAPKIVAAPEINKAAMQAFVEPALLDAKNANLRSSNNEFKITILEKKIEQLMLLVNKLQLRE